MANERYQIVDIIQAYFKRLTELEILPKPRNST